MERPYRTWGYPVTPVIFLAVVIGFMTMFYAYVVPSWVR